MPHALDVLETEADADADMDADEIPPELAEGDGDDGDGAADEEDPGEGDDAPAGLPWSRVAVLGAALTFLGFAVAVFVTRDSPPTRGSVDVGFYQDMISHHDQAIQMASLTIPDAADPTVRSFAADVLAFQEYEIGVMERTLHEWGYSRADRPTAAMQWMGMSVSSVADMPGMATDTEMQQLQDASGSQVDALFLQLMATHHRGGLHMAEYAAANAGNHDVRVLAQRMARNQAIEINEYAMLADRLSLNLDIETVEVPPGPGS